MSIEQEFQNLLKVVIDDLNRSAIDDPEFFRKSEGEKLETIVTDRLKKHSIGTPFFGHIRHVGGSRFPDIDCGIGFGVEVKSTTQDHWTTTGNSVLESTRVKGIDTVYIVFGKLGGDVKFKWKRYEDCLSEVVVTHYPRYKVDMNLAVKESIFSKLNMTYETIRLMENPVKPFQDYYKTLLREGETLWWIDNGSTIIEPVPIVIRNWSSLGIDEKNKIKIEALILFPELYMASSQVKYSRVSSWMLMQYGVVSSSLRDTFSAGGQVDIHVKGIRFRCVPRIFQHLYNDKAEILRFLATINLALVSEYWHMSIDRNNIRSTWISEIISNANDWGEFDAAGFITMLYSIK